MKEDNARYIDKLKATYQKDIEDYRGRYEEIKVKIALDINESTLTYVKERYQAYLDSFKQERFLESDTQVDSIELLFYIAMTQQVDKEWLMEKLGDAEKAKSEQAAEIRERREQWAGLKEQADASRLALEDIG